MSYKKLGILSNDVDFSLYSDRYLCHHSSILITRESSLPVRAYTVDTGNKVSNIISTIGELFEREILINKNQNNKCNVEAFSLIDGNIKEIPKNEIIYIDKFVDSCGMASHNISEQLINKALLEFYERQCLVLSFLSETPGKRIERDVCEEGILIKYKRYLLNYIDEMLFYNISISNQVYVILGIGIGEDNKCIGLGSGSNLSEAIRKSMEEMLQYFFCAYSKYSNCSSYNAPENESPRDMYHMYFDSLSSEELYEKYKYLEHGPTIKKSINKNFDMRKFLKEINTIFEMEPYIVFFPNQRNLPNLKIVKILDFKWFPSIFPRSFSKERFINVERITGRKLKRNCNYIPFP